MANSHKVLAHDLLPISENETLLYLGRLQTLSPTLDEKNPLWTKWVEAQYQSLLSGKNRERRGRLYTGYINSTFIVHNYYYIIIVYYYHSFITVL